MKFYKRNCLDKFFICVLLCFLTAEHSSQSLAEEVSGGQPRNISEDEMPIVLELIANNIRENYERIITWSGEIDVKLSRIETGAEAESTFKLFTNSSGKAPEAILQKIEEKIIFAIDGKHNHLYINNYQEKNQYFNNETGADLGRKSAHHIQSTSIFRPDFSLKAIPESLNMDFTIHRSKAIKKPSRLESRTGLYESVTYDPRRIFMPGSTFPWDHFDILIKKINRYGKIEFDGYRLKMEERIDGDNTEYKLIKPAVVSLLRRDPNHYVIETKVFSRQCGFNMTYWEVALGSGMLLQKFTYEYELISGVYLPKKTNERRYNSKGEISHEKNCVYIHNELNQEMSADTFEYVNINLKEGDIFIDKISNKEYRYEENTQTLKPIEK